MTHFLIVVRTSAVRRFVAGAAPRSDAGQGTGEPSRPSFSEHYG
jgi:hypothetical protein